MSKFYLQQWKKNLENVHKSKSEKMSQSLGLKYKVSTTKPAPTRTKMEINEVK